MLVRVCSLRSLVAVLPILLMGAGCNVAGFKPTAETGSPSPTVMQTQAQVPAAQASPPTTATFTASQRTAGFSSDGRYFMQLESSRDTGAGIPRASLQIVDLAENRCVPNGCITTSYGEADTQVSLTVAENSLLQKTQALRQSLNLTQPTSGKVLPLERSQTSGAGEVVTVQVQGAPMQLRLQQRQTLSPMFGGTAEKDKAAMELQITHQGKTRSLGSLEQYQEGVVSYSIREVLLSPDGQQVAVIITAIRPTFEGTLATTFIQGFGI